MPLHGWRAVGQGGCSRASCSSAAASTAWRGRPGSRPVRPAARRGSPAPRAAHQVSAGRRPPEQTRTAPLSPRSRGRGAARPAIASGSLGRWGARQTDPGEGLGGGTLAGSGAAARVQRRWCGLHGRGSSTRAPVTAIGGALGSAGRLAGPSNRLPTARLPRSRWRAAARRRGRASAEHDHGDEQPRRPVRRGPGSGGRGRLGRSRDNLAHLGGRQTRPSEEIHQPPWAWGRHDC